MSQIKVIKSKEDYEEALKLVETLMGHDPDYESEEGEKLRLLSTLIEDYEKRVFPEILPSPVDAIKFRMEQADLKPVDLVPYIGSRSRVSEILSGKRQLTLEMVRKLEVGLGIPAKVLIKKSDMDENLEYQNWDKRLVTEMEERGCFGKDSLKKHDKAKLLESFFSLIGSPAQAFGMLRQSNYRSSPSTSKRALAVWSVCVIKKANKIKMSKKYKHGVINLSFMQKFVKLNTEEKNLGLIQKYLKKYGIILIIEPHFSKTHLDGAVILINKDNPIIGLTIRYNRLDNFWFTLMHELAHVALHYNEDIGFFYDELEDVKGVDINKKEEEADKLAREALVPNSKWEISPAKLIPSPIAAQSLSDELGVHIAIIAGIMRHEHKNYFYLNKIVNKYKAPK